MQTFLPYPDFTETARCLDRQRLGKQRVEVLQILRTLRGVTAGWRHHPAVKMWKGFEAALAWYGLDVCKEWARRGYKDNCAGMIVILCPLDVTDASLPPWIGDEAFHLSHKSNLKRKMPHHYGFMWPDVPDDLPYIWPA